MIRYINEQIKESEQKRLAGLERAKEDLKGVSIDEIDQHSLKAFVRWYIQRSLNAQWDYGVNFTRTKIKEIDEKSGSISMETAKYSEASDIEYPSFEDVQSQPEENPHDKRKTAKTLVRSSRYQSQFG